MKRLVSTKAKSWEFHPLTPERWADFEQLFGKRGAAGGCWCMWWRLTAKDFDARKGEGNRRAMKAIVESGRIPGILAYHRGEVAGWCSVAPREQFGSLERSRVLKRVDNKDVWSIVCFFVDRNYRGKNLSLKLILGAIEYVKSRGGEIIEAYPSIIRSAKAAPVSTFMGIPKIFEKAGFKAVHTPSKSKLIMRYFIT